MSDRCLMPSSHIFGYFMVRIYSEKVTLQWDDDGVLSVLHQQAQLDYYTCSASSLKQKSDDRHYAPLWNIILILSQPFFTLTP